VGSENAPSTSNVLGSSEIPIARAKKQKDWPRASFFVLGLGEIYNHHMKFLVGLLVVLGSLFLIFQSRVVDFAPNQSIEVKKDATGKEALPLNIFFAGDVMLGRAVEERYKEADIFANVSEIFRGADAVVANLEGPILNNHIKTPYNSYKFSFATTTLGILKNSGFTDLSLANNHTDNYGRSGFVETILNLRGVGLNSFGDPNVISDYSFIQREINGRSFVFAGINDTYGNLSKESIFEFGRNLREKFSESVLVFVMHWGEEYKTTANSRQEELGRGLVDIGADLIIGSHPHVIQNIEKYNDKYIFYSLGNFVFDQYFSTSTQEGLVVKMSKGSECSFELFPVNIKRSVPEFMENAQKDSWLKEYSMNRGELSQFISSGCLK
jgi:poly-gamma-glutamate synthesis protein (capsule biosynthesis protein)